MKIFMTLVFLVFIISYPSATDEIKLSVIQCEYEQTSTDHPENPAERDTITYAGVFGSIKDSVLIYHTETDKIKICLRKLAEDRFSFCFYENDVVSDSLKIYCKDNLVYINDDHIHNLLSIR